MTSTWWDLDAMTGPHPGAVWAASGQEITYARLRHEVNAVRGALTEQGIGTGPGGATPVLEVHIATASSVTSEELTAWCRDRLSAFKIPRRWHIGADIPRTALGKAVRGGRLAAQR